MTLAHAGQYLATARETPPVVEVWRKTPAGYQHAWASTDQASDGLAFSPRGDVLVVADWGGDEIVVYDAASGRVERRTTAKQTWGSQFSPDGQQLAFTEEDDIVVWDWDADQPLRRLRAHLSTVTAVAYSPDGRRLASCGRDRRIILWDARTGERLRTMMGHRNYPVQVAFVGNDRLVSLSDEGRVLVWHAELGTQLCTLHADRANPCFHLALSPTQHWLACRLGDGTIQLLDVRSAR